MKDDREQVLSPGEWAGAALARVRAVAPWSIETSRDPLVLHVVVRGSFGLSSGDGALLRLRPGDIVVVADVLAQMERCAQTLFLLEETASLGADSARPQQGNRATGELLSAVYRSVAEPRRWPVRAPGLLHLPANDVQRDPGLCAVVGLLRVELESEPPRDERLALSLLDPLLAYAIRCRERARSGERGRDAMPAADERLARALDLMRADPARPWTVGALAKAAGLSRAAFARRFLGAMGVPPLRYLADWRMQLAAQLLEGGGDSLASIAARVGYESEFAFSRAFRRHHGVAPGAFRRRARLHTPQLGPGRTRAAA